MRGNVLDVARKELLDIARDRRAVFVMLVLPVVLYPLLMIGVTLVSAAQVRAMAGRRYVVWIDGEAPAGLVERLRAPEIGLELAPPGGPPATRFEALALLERGELGCILEVPGDLETTIAAATTEARVSVVWHGGVDASAFARGKVERAVAAWRDALVRERLVQRSLAPAFVAPVKAEPRDVGPRGAFVGRMLAMLLVIMCVSGAFYPAIDLGAGEKEHGTLETLLVSPARRRDIALGKLLAVFVVALAAALANLASLGLTFAHLSTLLPGPSAGLFESVSFGARTTLAMLSVLTPLALLFSAVALLVSTHAASYKEAQSYLTPVMIVAILPAMATSVPGFGLTPLVACLPVVGAAVLIKELLGGTATGVHILLVAASSAGYALLGVVAVARVYEREEVLFRPAAAQGLGLLVRPRTAGAVPTPAQALAAAVASLLLIWFIGMKAQARSPLGGLVLTLVACIAGPGVVYARALGLDLRATFRLRRPRVAALASAALLAPGAVVVSFLLTDLQSRFVGPPTEKEREAWQRITEELFAHGTGVALLIIAALPALCEEALFRGFVLTGLRRGVGPITASLASAGLFALAHLDPGRLLHSAVLDALMAALALRSGSLAPCVLFHLIHNASATLLQVHADAPAVRALFDIEAGRAPLPTSLGRALAVAALVVGGGLLLLVRPAAPAADADAKGAPGAL